MGYMGNQYYWFRICDFAGLSTAGVKVYILNPDGTNATLYTGERMQGVNANPWVLGESDVVGFWSALPTVDLYMVDEVRGSCLVRGVTVMDHRITFEPDGAGSKLLGSTASWSGDPFVVDCKQTGTYEISRPVEIDAGQIIIGDILHIQTRIVVDCTGVASASSPGTFRLHIGDYFLQNVNSIGIGGFDDGVHPIDVDVRAIALRTGAEGRMQYTVNALLKIKANGSTYYETFYPMMLAGPDYGEVFSLTGRPSVLWRCLRLDVVTKCTITVPLMTVELIRP